MTSRPLPPAAVASFAHATPCGAWLDDYIAFPQTAAPMNPRSLHEAAGLFLASLAVGRLGTRAVNKVAMLLAAMDTVALPVRVELRHFCRAVEIVEAWRASLHRLWAGAMIEAWHRTPRADGVIVVIAYAPMFPDKTHGCRWQSITSLVALVTLGLKLCIALTTIGTVDVLTWQRFATTARQFGGIALYRSTIYPPFNHPPFMVHLLRLLSLLVVRTRLPFPFWLRLPAILADLGSLVLVWKIVEPHADNREPQRALRAAVLLLAAAPLLIMISGFHGNTDPIMICFVLLGVYLLERRHALIPAGIALGMALNIKVVPVVVLPVFWCYLPTWRQRLTFVTAVAAVFGVSSLPYLLEDPRLVAGQVFGYSSNYGEWGFSRIFSLLAPRSYAVTIVDRAFAHFGRGIVAATIIAAAILSNRHRRPALFLQCGFAMFLFLALSPGFGVQYLAWLAPWVVALGPVSTAVFYTISGLFLFAVYTCWSGRLPWYYAIAGHCHNWNTRGDLLALGLLCWLSVVGGVLLYVDALSRPGRGELAPEQLTQEQKAGMR